MEECLITCRKFEPLFSSVQIHVALEPNFASESSVTNFTFKWEYVRMNQSVSMELVGCLESFPTFFALLQLTVTQPLTFTIAHAQWKNLKYSI
jgi:hypothetical protein